MLFTKFGLMGRSLSKYDRDWPVTFETDPESDGAKAVKAYLLENFVKPASDGGSMMDKLRAKRTRFESNGHNRESPSKRISPNLPGKRSPANGRWPKTPIQIAVFFIYTAALSLLAARLVTEPLLATYPKKPGAPYLLPIIDSCHARKQPTRQCRRLPICLPLDHRKWPQRSERDGETCYNGRFGRR